MSEDVAVAEPQVKSEETLSVIDKTILEGAREGLVYKEIATKVGKSPMTVALRINKLRLRGFVIPERRKGRRKGVAPTVSSTKAVKTAKKTPVRDASSDLLRTLQFVREVGGLKNARRVLDQIESSLGG